MILKQIEIDGRQVAFAVSARIPRLYRQYFGRDVLVDMASLSEHFEKAKKERNVKDISELDAITQLSLIDLTIFENLAFTMAKLASPDTVPNTADDWLDEFQTFDIYEVLPEMLDLWAKNQKGMSIPKKK